MKFLNTQKAISEAFFNLASDVKRNFILKSCDKDAKQGAYKWVMQGSSTHDMYQIEQK